MGDVIAIEQNGHIEITRIHTEGSMKIDRAECKLVIGESNEFSDNFYFYANDDGDMTVYSEQVEQYPRANNEEVFVYPDNWASNGTRGPVSKYSILGKLIGYDLASVTNTMTVEDLVLYDEFQQLVESMNPLIFNENPVHKLLKDVSPQTIAKLHLYANYNEDYKIMYTLFAKSDELASNYESLIAFIKIVNSKIVKQNLLTEIYLVSQSELSADESKLIWLDQTSEKSNCQLNVVKEDGIWKVVL